MCIKIDGVWCLARAPLFMQVIIPCGKIVRKSANGPISVFYMKTSLITNIILLFVKIDPMPGQ
jgi:hypothetical protein